MVKGAKLLVFILTLCSLFDQCGDGLLLEKMELRMWSLMTPLLSAFISFLMYQWIVSWWVCRTSSRRTAHRVLESRRTAHRVLERMRALSPPRTSDVQREDYTSWLLRHPSALDVFHRVAEAAGSGKLIAFFFDYDGTLSPIVDDPDRAYMTDEMRSAVRVIASFFPTGIVTGRSRKKVFDFVRLPELYYAGSHGMDIVAPVNENGYAETLLQPPTEYMRVLNEVYMLLEEKVKKVNGAKVENNEFSMSVHFRRVDLEVWIQLIQEVQDLISRYPQLLLTEGRKVLEIRLNLPKDKGTAVQFLMKAVDQEYQREIYPIYIGDDKSDEDAFKVVNRHSGLSILVSNTSKDTVAACSLQDPVDVLKFLKACASLTV